jgi:hypothetical protein
MTDREKFLREAARRDRAVEWDRQTAVEDGYALPPHLVRDRDEANARYEALQRAESRKGANDG